MRRFLPANSIQWSGLSVGAKFGFGFVLMLLLILSIAVTSYTSQWFVQQQTEATIVTSIQIQRLVLQMDAGLAKTRQLQQGFNLNYPIIGYEAAHDEYAQAALDQMERVVEQSRELQSIVAESALNEQLRQSDVNLNLYLASAERFIDIFQIFLDGVEQRANANDGLVTQLDQTLSQIDQLVSTADNVQLVRYLLAIQASYREYLNTGQSPLIQQSLNQLFSLNQASFNVDQLSDEQRDRLQKLGQQYEQLTQALLELDAKIAHNLRDFDLQTDAVDPVADELVQLAEAEVETARQQISQANRFATGVLVFTSVLGIVVAVLIAQQLNKSITQQIVALTDVATELEQGNLHVQANVSSPDEIGQLGRTFNQMTNRLRDTLERLEILLAERQATITKLEQADQAKSQFITMMSHELRTPLNAINGFAEMMTLGMSGELPKQAQSDAELIHKNGLHLADLVNDILEISQIESGYIELELEETPLDQIVVNALNELSPLNQGKSVKLMSDIPLDLPMVYVDRKRIRQILFNLLNNAIKFTHQGSVVVVVSRHSDYFVRVTVHDTGIGIPSEDLARIFGNFQQGDMSDAREYGGTGLGLALCQQLVELHGGEIGVSSEVGFGSEFWFTMPILNYSDSS